MNRALLERYRGESAAELIDLNKIFSLTIQYGQNNQSWPTQYINAQYQHSTRNGNLRSKRLSRRSWNTAVLGLETRRCNPPKTMSRSRQVSLYEGSSDGDRGYSPSLAGSPLLR
jgi:hypothetical protein